MLQTIAVQAQRQPWWHRNAFDSLFAALVLLAGGLVWWRLHAAMDGYVAMYLHENNALEPKAGNIFQSLVKSGKNSHNAQKFCGFRKQSRSLFITIDLKGVTEIEKSSMLCGRKTREQYLPKRSRFGLGI